MAFNHHVGKVIWIRRLCKEIGLKQGEVKIGCDSIIFLAKNVRLHTRRKHIDIQYHFIREKWNRKL